jgi:predicted RNA-binding Zn ribbon-like protein
VDFSHYTDAPVRMAVDLVNTLDAVDATERLQSAADVSSFLDQHSSDWPYAVASISEKDLHEVRAMRLRLRAVFDAADEDEAANELNTIMEDVSATPRISTHSGEAHLHFEPTETSAARWIGAVAAMGLSVVLIETGLDRFGTCASSTCEDVYVDTSRNRSRRHCSDTCSTRENVAAYRRRQRAG